MIYELLITFDMITSGGEGIWTSSLLDCKSIIYWLQNEALHELREQSLLFKRTDNKK